MLSIDEEEATIETLIRYLHDKSIPLNVLCHTADNLFTNNMIDKIANLTTTNISLRFSNNFPEDVAGHIKGLEKIKIFDWGNDINDHWKIIWIDNRAIEEDGKVYDYLWYIVSPYPHYYYYKFVEVTNLCLLYSDSENEAPNVQMLYANDLYDLSSEFEFRYRPDEYKKIYQIVHFNQKYWDHPPSGMFLRGN
jgi:hypothetical protein